MASPGEIFELNQERSDEELQVAASALFDLATDPSTPALEALRFYMQHDSIQVELQSRSAVYE